MLAGFVARTLALGTGLSCGTGDPQARVIDTTITNTFSSIFARVCLAIVGDAHTILADLARRALFVCARIVCALPVVADLSLRTKDTRAGIDALSVVTEGIRWTLFVGTEVIRTLPIATAFALRTRVGAAALATYALSIDAKVGAGTVLVKRTRWRRDALPKAANFARVGAAYVQAGVTFAAVGVCAADTTVFTGVGGTALFSFTGSCNADLACRALLACARIGLTGAIDTGLSCGALNG